MRKIISSILMISTAAALIGLGTFAYFSDTETSPSSITAASGTINIAVDWPIQPTGENTLADLKPSQVRYLKEVVRNVGENPAVIYKHTHVNGTSDEPVVDPEYKEGINAVGNYVPRSEINKVILYDLKTVIQGAAGNIENVIIPEPNGDENAPTLAQISSKWIKLGVLKPGETMVVIQSYHMNKRTTNWAQADSVNFSMDFKAVQTNDDTTFRRLNPNSIGDPDFDLWMHGGLNGTGDSFFDVFFDVS